LCSAINHGKKGEWSMDRTRREFLKISGFGPLALQALKEGHTSASSISINNHTNPLKLDSNVSIGDEAVLIGRQKNENISAHDLARWAEVSTCKILIGLSPLLPKISV
jgi:hypothetical protein